MNFFQLLVLSTMVAFASSAWAQSSPSRDNASAQAAASEPAASPSATVAVEPPSLIPPNILPAPGSLPKIPQAADLQQLNAFFKQTSLGKAADEHRLHLQMAALETQIRNERDLHALKASAQGAPTDLEKRHRLKAYYHLYFKKLRALAGTPELKTYLDAQEATHEVSLLQPKVRHESDEAEAAALHEASAGASATPALPTPAQARASEGLPP
jgi:hypothetical protein